MLIARSAIRQYMARPMDSHHWLKRVARDELLAELRRLPVRPVFKTKPWLHQLVCFYLALSHPQFLFLLDMGLGKTKIMLDVITQLVREQRVRRALVVAPRLINMAGWAEAAEEHSDLEPWLVDVEEIAAKFDRLINPRGELTVIDYQGLALACSKKVKGKKEGRLVLDAGKVAQVARRYDMLIPDESHKVGNHQSLWFSVVASLAEQMRYRYGLTGTLFARDFEAIWSQYRIIDGGQTFGENLGLFRSSFFTASTDPLKGEVLTFNRDTGRRLNQMIANRAIRYEYEDVPELDMPALVMRRRLMAMGEEQREHYLLALEGLINAGGDLREMKAQWFRMRQITSGYIQWSDAYGEHEQVFSFNPKLLELERLVDEAGAQKLVISCEYTRTGQLICDALTASGVKHVWLYGGSRDPVGVKRQFMDDPDTRVLVMNSEAGGTGVDGLQKVARFLILYESPSNPTPRSQVVKRVYRPGQHQRTFIIDLALSRTVDVGILDDLAADRDLFEEVMSGRPGIKSKLLGA